MHRVFCATPAPPEIGATVVLSSTDAHHVRDVLRADQGSVVLLVHPPTRTTFHARLEISQTTVHAIVVARVVGEAPRSRARTICPALLKGSHNDLIVEKCVELGVERLLFWEAHRSVVQLKGAKLLERERRLRAIGEAAALQSHKSYLPEVAIVEGLPELLDSLSTHTASLYCCSLLPDARELRALPPPTAGAFVVGPEGDFTPEEHAKLKYCGAIDITLGPFVLRAETGAIAAAAGANAAWGWLEGPSAA